MAKAKAKASSSSTTTDGPVALKVPQNKQKKLHSLLVKHGVPEDEIARLGGPGGFLSRFLGGLVGGQYPNLSKLIELLINKGIGSLGG
jgi:hypothetical protein